MPAWLGYIITFISGGFAGAILNRIFHLRDKAIKKLTLKIIKEEVKSIIPVIVNEKNYQNLISKKFVLHNTTNQDYPELDIVFEFDKGSEIVFKEISSQKHGTNKFAYTERKPSELVYHIKNFNRKQELAFSFEVGNITENFFCSIIDNCGVDIIVVNSQSYNQPSISPSKIVHKIDLE